MKRLNLDDYYETFISAGKLQGEATKTGDSKTANRQYNFLKRVFIKAKKLIDINDIEPVNIFYAHLRNHEEPNVQLFACAHSLALGISIKESENILAKLSQNKNIGILRLNAEMTLKVWKEQGYLRFQFLPVILYYPNTKSKKHMEIWHRIMFHSTDKVYDDVLVLNIKHKILPIPGGNKMMFIEISEDNPLWSEVKALAKENKSPDMYDTVFTNEEILTAEWNRLIPVFEQGYPQPEKIWNGKKKPLKILVLSVDLFLIKRLLFI